MAKVEFRPDVEINIPEAAFENARQSMFYEWKEGLKLQELMKKIIKELKKGNNLGFHYEINMLQNLLKESKK